MRWIYGRVADARQNLGGYENESGEGDHQREDVHFRQSRAPRRHGDPQSTDDDHELDGQITKESRSALTLVGPERERDAERGNQNQARTAADHRRALLRPLLG